MKKFLAKKPVMITFVVITVLMLALYIGMLVRPVSYGMTYKATIAQNGNIVETEKFKINSDKSARITSTTTVDGEVEVQDVDDVWIYRDGETIYIVGTKKHISKIQGGEEVSDETIEASNKYCLTKNEYKKVVENLKKGKENGTVAYAAALVANGAIKYADEVGIYKSNVYDIKVAEAKCTGAVVFTVIGAVVLVGLVAFTTLSVVFVVKSKKKKGKK